MQVLELSTRATLSSTWGFPSKPDRVPSLLQAVPPRDLPEKGVASTLKPRVGL